MHFTAASDAEVEVAGVRDELLAGVAERREDDVQQRPEHRLQPQFLVDHEELQGRVPVYNQHLAKSHKFIVQIFDQQSQIGRSFDVEIESGCIYQTCHECRKRSSDFYLTLIEDVVLAT